MKFEAHLAAVAAAQKDLEAMKPRTAAISVAIQKAIVFRRALNQCVAETNATQQVIADVNQQIDQINAQAAPN